MSCIISLVIPHRNSITTLPRLLNSIPVDPRIEVIIVDNSPKPICKDDIVSTRPFLLYYSAINLYGGGARNEGIRHAHGKWLLFADADDFFKEDAFDFFLSQVDSDSDIIYTCMTGWNDVTNNYCNRGETYSRMVHEYLSGNIPGKAIRYMFHSPCCKMTKKELINKHRLRFSEVITGNDALFSVMTGHYAHKIEAFERTTYVATISGHNISRKYDFESVLSRYIEDLKINRFLRHHGQWRWQLPILETIKQFGRRKKIQLLWLAIKYGQPLFVDYYTQARYERLFSPK